MTDIETFYELVIAALLAVAAALPQDPVNDPSEELRAADIIQIETSRNVDGFFQYLPPPPSGEGPESFQDVFKLSFRIGEDAV
ncbi:hypothetical protein FJT64_017488 [Amphibalanus amphitrite]|uniref:Uncharacterized protein n=1 Tax=Amphibalanus amphitrite TaxID=1232801 RepID=A0A6A4X2N0_AMPAM|nr:hypothetical protein FJT64_017488 [Amphibalanus amphitrite]